MCKISKHSCFSTKLKSVFEAWMMNLIHIAGTSCPAERLNI